MVLVEILIGDKAIFVNFAIHFEVIHSKVASPHLSVNILWTVEDFAQISQGFFDIRSQIVGFFDFSLADS